MKNKTLRQCRYTLKKQVQQLHLSEEYGRELFVTHLRFMLEYFEQFTEPFYTIRVKEIKDALKIYDEFAAVWQGVDMENLVLVRETRIKEQKLWRRFWYRISRHYLDWWD